MKNGLRGPAPSCQQDDIGLTGTPRRPRLEAADHSSRAMPELAQRRRRQRRRSLVAEQNYARRGRRSARRATARRVGAPFVTSASARSRRDRLAVALMALPQVDQIAPASRLGQRLLWGDAVSSARPARAARRSIDAPRQSGFTTRSDLPQRPRAGAAAVVDDRRPSGAAGRVTRIVTAGPGSGGGRGGCRWADVESPPTPISWLCVGRRHPPGLHAPRPRRPSPRRATCRGRTRCRDRATSTAATPTRRRFVQQVNVRSSGIVATWRSYVAARTRCPERAWSL